MDKKKGRIGLGMIARDIAGKVVAAQSTMQDCTGEPAMAEALATLHAMLFCQELDLHILFLKEMRCKL